MCVKRRVPAEDDDVGRVAFVQARDAKEAPRLSTRLRRVQLPVHSAGNSSPTSAAMLPWVRVRSGQP